MGWSLPSQPKHFPPALGNAHCLMEALMTPGKRALQLKKRKFSKKSESENWKENVEQSESKKSTRQRPLPDGSLDDSRVT